MSEFIQHKQPLAIDGTLIDLETTGIPGVTSSHEIITLGYAESHSVSVVQRTCKTKHPFYRSINRLLSELPRPFYAYNASFERRILEIELGMRFQENDLVDIMRPWKSKSSAVAKKWPSLDQLVSEPEAYYGEERVSGSQVPGLWNSFVQGRSSSDVLKLIADHCHSDLLRELLLLLRYPMTERETTPVSLLKLQNSSWVAH